MSNIYGQSYAKERSEDDVITHAPVSIRLGGETYDVKPLTLLKSSAWRKQFVGVINEITQNTTVNVSTSQDLSNGLMVLLFTFPERVQELLFAYSPELESKKEHITEHATDEEMVVAMSRIMVVAFPFIGLLTTMRAAAGAANGTTPR